MKLTIIPPVDPEIVRAAEGFNPKATFYQPRKQRPAAFSQLDGKPGRVDPRPVREAM